MTAGRTLLSNALDLQLVLWNGRYSHAETTWLRWATLQGELLLPAEVAEQRAASEAKARRQAELELEAQRAEIARLHALLTQKE